MEFTVRFLILSAILVAVLSEKSSKENIEKVIKVLQSDKNVKLLVENVEKNLKRAATLGVALGTEKATQKMQLNILQLLHDFIKTIQGANMRQTMMKYQKIEDTIDRDKKAVEILSNAIKLATKTETLDEYHSALKELSKNQTKSAQKQSKFIPKSKIELMAKLKTDVDDHVNFLRKKVDTTVKETLDSMKLNEKKSEISSTLSTITSLSSSTHANDIFKHETYNLPQLLIRMPLWPVGVESLNFYRFRRQNDDDVSDNEISNDKIDEENSNGDDFDESNDGGNGIAGLLGSLSGGGDGGSDVGALVGAISGVVTSLFGPGGLDIPSLISTGTSLISGLLGKDENFGKVLGSYIGIAVEGLSGGGGADNNGAFFGNFVGTLFAQLSADPEEDDEPPKPKIFFENFFKGLQQSKQKRGVNETNTSNNKSYIFEFLSNLLSSVIGGITNLVLNASFGSSGGSSNGAADLSAGSSQGSHTGSAYASQSSASSSMMPSNMNSKPK
ncbi:hypothetical protein PVAND_012478 [Polypedilum vanderplanki]|uniref:Uncharacterized protein n=1 Tax=Polypedilum vanderplanki TaxID=319348 RepID=A0A9J6CNL0_POLVA|nr:hypothetical protein PVAND_012478 [Polypedilum vanderplanki]